ncbi:HelA protein [Legionella steelei]|uniref:HelA protein n=1 Tax=Legionella steelei TaxID=947033 RepID=A0A0W0ZBW7_9GAMM|nr:efflux RND transporter permease subunit [Legionella steelei]KTD66690.1 HelA protein [Legionella steelei]
MIGAWLQKHRMSVLFLLILLTFGGLLTAFKLPVMLFPNIQFPRILVLVDSGDRPVDRMIVEVTEPLEQALRAVPEVISIRSTSSRGTAELSVNFNWNSDMVTALLQVESAINQVLPKLPHETTFTAQRMDPIIYPILSLSLTSNQSDLVSLRDFAYFQLRPMLSVVPGVAKVQVVGGQEAEYQVLVDPMKLQAANITLNEVITALTANNIVTAVGRLEEHYRLYLILSDTRLRNVDDLNHTILRSSTSGIIDLDDVATVIKSTVPQWTRVTANGKDAVLLNILQQPGASTVSIAKKIKQQLKNFHDQIPADIQVKAWYDQSQLITGAADSVRDAILIGIVLAVIILFLFLRNIRMTLIVAIILPCVLITSILLLYVLNMSFNIMTLGGMASAVGLVIDDGVVMLEYIMRRLSEGHKGEPTHGPVLSAAMQMLHPLAGSSLATIIIFLPLAFIGGITGGFFKALAITMATALIISFFFAFLVVPLLGEMLLKQVDAKKLERAGPKLKKTYKIYHSFMRLFLKKSIWSILSILIILFIGYFSYTQVGSGFMPKMDEGGFTLDYITQPGTSLTETDRLLKQVEQIIKKTPEVRNYSRRTGLQLGGGLTEPNTGDFFIRLNPPPRRDIDEIMTEVRHQINLLVPGIKVETAQLMEDMIGDLTAVPQPIEIKVFGDNEHVLQNTAKKIAKLISTVPGVVEIKNGIVISGDAIIIKINRIKAALKNLDPESITKQIQTQLMGTVVSQIQQGEKVVGIRVWTPPALHDRIEKLKLLPLRTATGHYVSLQNVAEITIEKGQAEITRENLKSMIAVTARIENRDMGTTLAEIKTKMNHFTLPPHVYIQYGGLYEEQQHSFYQLIIVFISAVLLVAGLLLYLYENVLIVLSILFTTLLSISGIFFGLWITNTELNISSMMGMTMIIGIVTEIAIFYFAELRTHHRHNRNTIITSGIMRMRPILMTSIIAILSLLPLALSIGTGSGMQQPLAIAIISGLILAVPLVLILMPAIYLMLNQLKYSTSDKR